MFLVGRQLMPLACRWYTGMPIREADTGTRTPKNCLHGIYRMSSSGFYATDRASRPCRACTRTCARPGRPWREPAAQVMGSNSPGRFQVAARMARQRTQHSVFSVPELSSFLPDTELELALYWWWQGSEVAAAAADVGFPLGAFLDRAGRKADLVLFEHQEHHQAHNGDADHYQEVPCAHVRGNQRFRRRGLCRAMIRNLVMAAIVGSLYSAAHATLPLDMRNWLPLVVAVIALAGTLGWFHSRQSK